jgi:glyoxylase-like metal-dependent hydrolase (beta-lactamase superfamily II)
VQPACDVDRIASHLAIWHAYDPAVKAELYSTYLVTSDGAYFIDPILLEREALKELIGPESVAGIVVTNANHRRMAGRFAEQFAVPIVAQPETFPGEEPNSLRRAADGDEISDGLRLICIEGAAKGEIALHYAPDGGTFFIGDALTNFESHGFTFLPAKYCSNQKQMRRSLRKLLAYKTERMFFAHGTPILSGAGERLQSLLESDL